MSCEFLGNDRHAGDRHGRVYLLSRLSIEIPGRQRHISLDWHTVRSDKWATLMLAA